jgi:hypothetical protein
MSNKKSVQNFRRTRRKSKPEISKAEHKFNCERVADMIMSVIDRLPPNPAPVVESYAELLAQMNAPLLAPVVVNNQLGELVKYNLDGSLEILNSGVVPSVAVRNPADDTKFESTAEDQNQTAKRLLDTKKEKFGKKDIPLGTTLNFPLETTKQDSGKIKFTDLELELIRQIENAK